MTLTPFISTNPTPPTFQQQTLTTGSTQYFIRINVITKTKRNETKRNGSNFLMWIIWGKVKCRNQCIEHQFVMRQSAVPPISHSRDSYLINNPICLLLPIHIILFVGTISKDQFTAYGTMEWNPNENKTLWYETGLDFSFATFNPIQRHVAICPKKCKWVYGETSYRKFCTRSRLCKYVWDLACSGVEV